MPGCLSLGPQADAWVPEPSACLTAGSGHGEGEQRGQGGSVSHPPLPTRSSSPDPAGSEPCAWVPETRELPVSPWREVAVSAGWSGHCVRLFTASKWHLGHKAARNVPPRVLENFQPLHESLRSHRQVTHLPSCDLSKQNKRKVIPQSGEGRPSPCRTLSYKTDSQTQRSSPSSPMHSFPVPSVPQCLGTSLSDRSPHFEIKVGLFLHLLP